MEPLDGLVSATGTLIRTTVVHEGAVRSVDPISSTPVAPAAKAIAAAFQQAGSEHYEEVGVTLALDGDATMTGLDRIFEELAGKVRQRPERERSLTARRNCTQRQSAKNRLSLHRVGVARSEQAHE